MRNIGLHLVLGALLAKARMAAAFIVVGPHRGVAIAVAPLQRRRRRAPPSRGRIAELQARKDERPSVVPDRYESLHHAGMTRSVRNEFARPIHTDRIHNKKDYTIHIAAKHRERDALAKRFDLMNVTSLEAELCLRLDNQQHAHHGITVEGSIISTVTQRCVRTNEAFDISVQVPVYSIVRPVVIMASKSGMDGMVVESHVMDRRRPPTSPKFKAGTTSVFDQDLLQLQNMLQDSISDEDDILMEDPSIYSGNGMIDVGELVAQLFWLALDPYPKKPGTVPVTASVSTKPPGKEM